MASNYFNFVWKLYYNKNIIYFISWSGKICSVIKSHAQVCHKNRSHKLNPSSSAAFRGRYHKRTFTIFDSGICIKLWCGLAYYRWQQNWYQRHFYTSAGSRIILVRYPRGIFARWSIAFDVIYYNLGFKAKYGFWFVAKTYQQVENLNVPVTIKCTCDNFLALKLHVGLKKLSRSGFSTFPSITYNREWGSLVREVGTIPSDTSSNPLSKKS